MTNVEFLVNELRKANETIDTLKKENTKLRDLTSALRTKCAAGDMELLAMWKRTIENM